MKIAIIGAGFAGLATAFFLLQEKVEVHIFEIGGGASRIASGLLHPYPGLGARRSAHAEEALAVAKQLLRVSERHTPKMVASHAGILRRSLDKEQQERLLSHCSVFGDVQQLDATLFLIHSGITVISKNYLEGLSKAIEKMGGIFFFQKIQTLKELEGFDRVVLACGYGIKSFLDYEHLKMKFLKGQVLTMEGVPPCEKSMISKGYIAHLGTTTRFEIGSTYERDFSTTSPNISVAKKLLEQKLALCKEANIINCKAGVRVCMQGNYLPLITSINSRVHVFTGLGSRGLLYHGLYGRRLANSIVSNKVFP